MGATKIITGGLCILTAIALQAQVTLFSSADYLGLRLNAFDLLVPFAGIAILYTLLTGKSQWPQWPMLHFYLWLGSLSTVLIAALLNGYFHYGEISRWALTNKLGGWFILLAILGSGGWFSTNAKREQIEWFFKIFIYLGTAILFAQCFILLAWAYPLLNLTVPAHQDWVTYPIAGLMTNRNAYGFFIVTLTALATTFYFSKTNILKPWLVYILYFTMPFFVIYNGSRASIFTLVAITLCQILINIRQWKKILWLCLSIGLGLSLFYAAYQYRPERIFYFQMQTYEVLHEEKRAETGKNLSYPGDTMRLGILDRTIHMAKENPVFGSGLGSVMLEQKKDGVQDANVIDNTPLWLLVETGIVGLLAFAGFYIATVQKLFQKLKDSDEFSRAVQIGILFTIAGFTMMCLFHEIMYTRHLWFLLGIALALPSKTHQNE